MAIYQALNKFITDESATSKVIYLIKVSADIIGKPKSSTTGKSDRDYSIVRQLDCKEIKF